MTFNDSRINMKRFLLLIFICLISFTVVRTQTSETVSHLIPVASNIGKFSKRLPKLSDRVINKDNLKFLVSAMPVNLPDNKEGVAITIQASSNDVSFEDIGGDPTARLKIYGRITSKDDKTDGFFEEKIEEIATIDELVNSIDKKIVLRKVFELPEGNYQIGVIITDVFSGMRGVKVVKFDISEAINPSDK